MAETIAIQEAVHLVHASKDSNGQAYPDSFLHLTFEFVEEEGLWCGHCVELGTAAFAETREQARHELLEATTLQLAGVEQFNELEEYLKKNGVPRYLISPVVDEQELLNHETVFAEAVPA